MIELRRRDLDLGGQVIRVRRGAARAAGQVIIDTPKSDAGVRDVAIPPHLIPLLENHLNRQTAGGKDALLFPAADGRSTLSPSTFYGRASETVVRHGTVRIKPGRGFYGARETAGRPDLRLHDLRHTGAVLAAQTGATLAELMGRLGHSTPQAALVYQHAAQGRDAQIAAALSRMVEKAPS
jgi:integrase